MHCRHMSTEEKLLDVNIEYIPRKSTSLVLLENPTASGIVAVRTGIEECQARIAVFLTWVWDRRGIEVASYPWWTSHHD